MRNVTFSADATVIDRARLVASSRHKTLNDAFREWLAQYASGSGSPEEVDALMHRLRHVKAGRTFTRDEMNER